LQIIGDLDDRQKQRLLEIAGKCPMHRTLDGKTDIETTLLDYTSRFETSQLLW